MITKGLLLNAYNLLSQAELSKLSFDERVEVVKALRCVRQEAASVQDFISEIQKAGDGADKVQINRAINEELFKAAETKDIPSLSDDSFKHLIESNGGWNAAVIMLVEDVFKV